MTNNWFLALSLAGTLVVLFGSVIFFSLRIRKRNFAKNLALKAVDVWPQIQHSGLDLSGLLYGVWQDFSATRLGMIVRDCEDHQVGTITYYIGARQGCISIETPTGDFKVDALATWREAASLRAATDGSPGLCDFTRLAGGTYRFDAKSLGALVSSPSRRLALAPVFEYTLNGTPVGIARHIGGWFDHGRMLVLPQTIPLPIRLFVLAIQGQRF